MAEETKKKTTKPKAPRVPAHVKNAAAGLADHTKCEVTPSKEDDGWVLLLASHETELPKRWAGCEVRRAW